MEFGPLEQLGRSLYYALSPALTIDSGGRVIDYNLALEALAPADLNGRRGEMLDVLGGRLSRCVVRGDLIPSGREPGGIARCVFAAPGLGSVTMTGQVVACHDPATGAPLGRVASWEVVAAEGDDPFHLRHRSRLEHELKWYTYAQSYDRVLCLMPYYQEVIRRHLTALGTAGDGPLVDLGAGTGNLVEPLIAIGRHVTAIDNSRAMLDKLLSKANLAEQLGRRLRIIEASIASLPMLDDGAFAGASILLTLFDMGTPERALDTAIRLIRPGGVIVVTELKQSFDVDPILSECEYHLKQLGRYDELRDDLNRVVRSNRDLAPGSRSQFRAEEVLRDLEARGFQELSWEDSHFGQCATVTGRKPGGVNGSRGGAGQP